MRRVPARYVAGAAVLALAVPILAPLLAQDAPVSLLPPGFGDDDDTPSQPAPRPTPSPTPGNVPANTPVGTPSLSLDLADDVTSNVSSAESELTEEEALAQAQKYDLPPNARRSLDRIGPLTPEARGFPANAFGVTSGKYLAALLRQSRAPFVSRWGSILLRRALLSGTDTPSDINGADWIAERAWVLLRMGEADAARLLVQSVDPDRFTPRLYAIAMQTYLATADPEGLCPLSAGALVTSDEPGWQLSRAICAALSGDQGTASAVLNSVERGGVARGIDYRLAEKVVGAGMNGRRSVTIEWDGVTQLTAWRYGLATATNVPIPDALYATVGSHVRAWEARAPMLSYARRQPGVETAARLGVFSSAALVDYYSTMAEDPDAAPEVLDRAAALRTAWIGNRVSGRLDAMRTLWTREGDARADYVSLIALAHAAARMPVTDTVGEDSARLIAAMLTAGYDRNAMEWAQVVGEIDGAGGQDAWALLAVGAPQRVVDTGSARVASYIDADDSAYKAKARMLVAALAALGRLSGADVQQLATDAGVNLTATSQWSRALDSAARRREPGTVAVLAAVGMQTSGWDRMPAAHLYHIVSALNRVGLGAEARMIAAEAITRL